ncbi:unnamed protein product [Didymodactylos carnosus]|uniref:TFIID subunit TAF5 NTD2 domain-containing protein n=1 Tax=Didymodactylos carnosus TaxID=1234261 RepID=A0A814IY58_9BILA|nr:unnamed protein product [Didymodactylos carnosus]CAF3801004.1 unnamed protein product [Didymodactylos carnosus]
MERLFIASRQEPHMLSDYPYQNASNVAPVNQIQAIQSSSYLYRSVPDNSSTVIESNSIRSIDSTTLNDDKIKKFEVSCPHITPDLIELLRFLRGNNMKKTEDCLRKEFKNLVENITSPSKFPLRCYTRPHDYFEVYQLIVTFILSNIMSSTSANNELLQLLFPLFVHFYIDLIEQQYLEESEQFFNKYTTYFIPYYIEFLLQLRVIKHSSHILRNSLTYALRSSRFLIYLSLTTCNVLQKFIESLILQHHYGYKSQFTPLTQQQTSLLLSIFQTYLKIDIKKQMWKPVNVVRFPVSDIKQSTNNNIDKDGQKQRIDWNNVQIPVFVQHHLTHNFQLSRLFTGVFTTLTRSNDEEISQKRQVNEFSLDKPKRLSQKKLLLQSKYQSNIPPIQRVPLPENKLPISTEDKSNNVNVPRFSSTQLPSICMFTVKNSINQVNCITFSDDCMLIAIGFHSAKILICSIGSTKLKILKCSQTLNSILNNSTLLSGLLYGNLDINEISLEKYGEKSEICLIGHCGPIYAVRFEPVKQSYLLSGSQDCTIRLWSLLTWTCLLVYKQHIQAVIDIQFAPYGHYFASCGADGLACIWVTDKATPVRVYPEHGQIYCVQFHPNGNYFAAACHTNSIRLWDIVQCDNNSLVRLFNGHQKQISVLKFSSCGRLLVSGSYDCSVILWDIQDSVMIANLSAHTDAIIALQFSITGNLLITGGIDYTINIWDFIQIINIYNEKINDESYSDELTKTKNNDNITAQSHIKLASFQTKETPIFDLHVSKQNILYAIGPILSN